jgi:pSer/pThr/pTyr-binding forkhead associated (FHA) protein
VAKLVLFLPDGTTLDVPLEHERTTIGRRSDNDICLPNLAVSGEHAVVVTILADSFLEDLKSTNGTLVNGEPVAKHFLRDRDEIDIGRHKLIYCVDDDASTEPERLEGMARGVERGFGGRVDMGKPFVKSQGKAQRKAPSAGNSTAERSPRTPSHAEAAIDLPPPPVEGPDLDATMPSMPAPITGPAIKLLTGVRAGTAVALTKPETIVGRPGVQVASIIQADGRHRLKPLEGISPPTLNGQPVSADGVELSPGDTIEIAGTRLEFVVIDRRPGEGRA